MGSSPPTMTPHDPSSAHATHAKAERTTSGDLQLSVHSFPEDPPDPLYPSVANKGSGVVSGPFDSDPIQYVATSLTVRSVETVTPLFSEHSMRASLTSPLPMLA